ncbi:uncharacterized protein PITG_14182 [Phytophthora infestans T30-4]|uniref:PH domain-containing protein n=1 Tax=Phytophthora infestans (strain T30-4) TaxID=403677 RepID=D0NNT9_PHYIT|nr:uncharacterized protein PITG_14182 [Phytophthora infestans T30-4]EEY62260.1 conserved hypothetical protein [Phytophthora infestans T30-4]|eukprot:XP_002899291.1 conserved hypothetical protein [Phytophthora infestans T30-4]
MLVNGVDISMLEGWMIKINSNPSFFGKNMNRRWFKVGFVPGPGSEKKLVISYSTSKTAKDPRGWLYVEDVSGIYCRRVRNVSEMIEIVSPSRTLRLKGETAVEHRLWSDSLYKLCHPPSKPEPTTANTTPAAPRRERSSHTQRETKQAEEEEEDRAQRKQRADRDRDRQRERERGPERERDPVVAVLGTITRSVTQGNAALRRQRIASRDVKSESLLPSEQDVSDGDSSGDGQDSSRPSTNSSTRSLLVAQIKSGSSLEDSMAQCKNVMSDSEEEEEEEDADENRHENEAEESPREPLTSSTDPIDDEVSHEPMTPQRMNFTEPTKQKASDYFDSDEEEHEQPPSRGKTSHNDHKAPESSVTADNNFAHDDWDAQEEPTSQPAATKTAAYSSALTGGVAADANFVHDDWDD